MRTSCKSQPDVFYVHPTLLALVGLQQGVQLNIAVGGNKIHVIKIVRYIMIELINMCVESDIKKTQCKQEHYSELW